MSYMTTDDGETMCNTCGALVRSRPAHDKHHEDTRKELAQLWGNLAAKQDAIQALLKAGQPITGQSDEKIQELADWINQGGA